MATEPVTTGSSAFIVAGAVGTLLGPVFGPVVLILFGGLIGGLLSLSRVKVEGKLESVVFVIVSMGVSLTLTGACVWGLEHFTPFPGNVALMPVALVLALARTHLSDFLQRMLDIAAKFVAKRAGVSGGAANE